MASPRSNRRAKSERRTGSDRRSGKDRRDPSVIPIDAERRKGKERRSGVDRRSGAERRGADLSPAEQVRLALSLISQAIEQGTLDDEGLRQLDGALVRLKFALERLQSSTTPP